MNVTGELDSAALDRLSMALALADRDERPGLARELRHQAEAFGARPASIRSVYRAMAEGRIAALTVPAMNVRGLTYRIARVAWRTALRRRAAPLLFELAPSEVEAGDQSFAEYAAMVLAAAAREGYRGPVYLQGDHIEVSDASPEATARARAWCGEAADAGLKQVDIDAAGLSLPGASAGERQGQNARVTAELAAYVRELVPDAVVGGEVGEIGGANTSLEDLRAFLDGVRARTAEAAGGTLTSGVGVDKVSVQTGTRHGGVVRPDGSVGKMEVDLAQAGLLASVAREEYGLPGVVQHGASTLTFEQLSALPEAGVIEVHLATGIQNLVMDHAALPEDLVRRMRETLAGPLRPAESGASEDFDGLTPEQVWRKNRWQAWGRFKRELWSLPEDVTQALEEDLEVWFERLYEALWVAERAPDIASLNDA